MEIALRLTPESFDSFSCERPAAFLRCLSATANRHEKSCDPVNFNDCHYGIDARLRYVTYVTASIVALLRRKSERLRPSSLGLEPSDQINSTMKTIPLTRRTSLIAMLTLIVTAGIVFAAVCPLCNGSGTGPLQCVTCRGTGTLNGLKCIACDGKRFVKCSACGGSGQR